LLHQLGHVFGMPHNSVFVMDEHVAGTFFETESQVPFERDWYADPILPFLFGHIESPSWPYRWREGESLELTFNGGIQRKKDEDSGVYSADHPRAYPNQTVPSDLRRAFGLDDRGWY